MPSQSRSTTQERGSQSKMPEDVQIDQEDADLELLASDEDDSEHTVFDLLRGEVRFRQDPVEFLSSIQKQYFGTNWRSYDQYIGARLYFQGWRDKMLDETISRPVVENAMSDLVQRRMDMEQSWNLSPQERDERRAVYFNCVRNMVRSIGIKAMPWFKDVGTTKFMYWVVAQTLSRCYHQGLHVSRADIKRLRAKCRELEAKKQSLLLFPCHKSHIDYISLVFICFRLGISLPATIAGDNLDVFVLNRFLRECGGLYIRRGKWSEDPLYSAFFQGLIESLLRGGVNFQCFIEGTRSRTGKLLPPKFGILKFVLETILSGSVEDAWVLPISTQYDKVVEADTYATELLGREKKSESFTSFLKSSSVLSLKLGRIDVRFGEIWSLRSFVIQHLQMEAVVSFPLPRPISREQSQHMLKALGYRILADINRASVVMPSALVGTALLTTTQRGVSHNQLIDRVQWLIGRVVDSGGKVGAIRKDPRTLTRDEITALVDNAMNVLGSDLVTVESKKLLETIYYPKDEFKLSYYRNQTVFLFVAEAVVSLAISTLNHTSYTKVPYAELEKKVLFLSRLLSNEFVYGTEGLSTNLRHTLNELERSRVINLSDNGQTITVNYEEIHRDIQVFDLYCYLVWPYIDGYWSTIMSLFILPPGGQVPERDFFRVAQSVARTLYAQGELAHSEALNQEMIKFAVQAYTAQGIVVRTVLPTGVACLSLAERYEPRVGPNGSVLLEGPLYDIAEEMALSRNKRLRLNITRQITQRTIDLCAPHAAELSIPKL